MIKALLIGALLLLIAVGAQASQINLKGAAGVCVAVATTAVTTVADYKATRPGITLYATTAMNCMVGPSTGGAPAIAPTTGAPGTGKGFPIPVTTYYQINAIRSIPLSAGHALNLDPAARIDCIAASANGNVCTWESE